MRPPARWLTACWTALLAACVDVRPPASYDAFTIRLVGLSEGDRVFHGQTLEYEVDYLGDLARDLEYRVVYTHEESGESVSVGWPSSPFVDTSRIHEGGALRLQNEFLERPGRIRIQLRASIVATLAGSTPWEVNSQSVYVEHHPSLDGIEVELPAATPLPYATPIAFAVTGTDLRLAVGVTVVDLDTGAMVPGLEKALPFDGTQASLGASWTIRAPELERVGTHHLALVARYGDLVLQSEPIAFEVTHTIDEVKPLVRLTDGSVWPSSSGALGGVTGVGVRITGTQLAGHEVTVNGGTPVVAAADEIDLVVLDPTADDFDAGAGFHTYDFVVRSGGMERTAAVKLQRWGIHGCRWRSADGLSLEPGARVPRGTPVVMHASLWGFPDTETYLWIFKRPQAEFAIWEADPAGRQWDPFGNNDDEVDSWDADIRSDETQQGWTAVYDEEFHLDPLVWNPAEYYFEVKVEDQLCTSSKIVVPPE